MPSPRRALTTLFLIVFTDLVGFGIVIPLLPLYAEHFHPAPWQFGLLMSAYSAMQFVFSPILGRLSDRVGRRPVLLISLAGSVTGFVLFALAHSLAWLFASRLLAGACGGNIATAQAVIADTTPPEKRAHGMGLIGAAFGLGFIAGPALAGLLAPISLSAPGWGAAVFSVAAWTMTLLFLPETRPAAGPDRSAVPASGLGRLRYAFGHTELAPLMAIGFLFVTGFAAFEVTFAQFVHERLGLAHSGVGFLFVYIGVLAAAVQGGLVGRATRRFGERKLLLGGLTLGTTGLVLLSLTHTLAGVMAVLPLASLGAGLCTPSLSSLISRAASGEHQGGVLGVAQACGAFARIVGPLAGTFALGFSVQMPYFIGGAVMLLACVFALVAVTQPA